MIGKDACPFCERIRRDDYDAAWLGGVTFEPLNPVTPGHRLFVSERHESPLTNPFGYDDGAGRVRGVGAVLPLLYRWRRENGIREQFNLILNAGSAASQTIEHLHLHYIPRRPGDGLALPWTEGHRP